MKLKSKRLVVSTVLLLFLLGGLAFYFEGSLPMDKNDKQNRVFVIPPGQGLNAIAKDLEKDGFIRNKIVFILVVKQLGIEKNIQAGDYRLNSSLSASELAKSLTKGSLDTWFTVIEGLRNEEIADQVTKDLGIPSADFLANAQQGYLFPDTYLIPKDATSETVLSIMRNNFNSKFTPEMKSKALKNGLTENGVVILASLLEREAIFDADRQEIANIMLRRIEEGHKLQIDATVQYALGYQPVEKTWWKKSLTLEDLKFESPFNTYLISGLPPTPISNPGKASLDAVVNATKDTPNLFYIHDSKGRTHYATNLAGHQRNIDKYLQ